MKRIAFATALVVLGATWHARVGASDPATGDWPMWGGTPDRNMVSNMKGLPTEWDIKTKKNVKWVADLGSQSYGNIVVSGPLKELLDSPDSLTGAYLRGERRIETPRVRRPALRGVLRRWRMPPIVHWW
jgi:hypothetical protein